MPASKCVWLPPKIGRIQTRICNCVFFLLSVSFSFSLSPYLFSKIRAYIIQQIQVAHLIVKIKATTTTTTTKVVCSQITPSWSFIFEESNVNYAVGLFFFTFIFCFEIWIFKNLFFFNFLLTHFIIIIIIIYNKIIYFKQIMICLALCLLFYWSKKKKWSEKPKFIKFFQKKKIKSCFFELWV